MTNKIKETAHQVWKKTQARQSIIAKLHKAEKTLKTERHKLEKLNQLSFDDPGKAVELKAEIRKQKEVVELAEDHVKQFQGTGSNNDPVEKFIKELVNPVDTLCDELKDKLKEIEEINQQLNDIRDAVNLASRYAPVNIPVMFNVSNYPANKDELERKLDHFSNDINQFKKQTKKHR